MPTKVPQKCLTCAHLPIERVLELHGNSGSNCYVESSCKHRRSRIRNRESIKTRRNRHNAIELEKIDLDAQLYRWRQVVVDAGEVSAAKRVMVTAGALILARPRVLGLLGRVVRIALRALPAALTRRLAGTWGRDRALPEAPPDSFRAWYATNRTKRATETPP